ncbi:MAG TPA: UDP-2,4-diacetamido-2,4,6-trideoxy-beta-L-altropyranose hydrolase [Opitutae bacterium]|nr:UDP-2,4-diacetamido-2,4,6-trideoxy-beta-L-altropyranose hydrolase [Puniceicoccaceae bacterium]HBR94200.1 UDP-2,4-diacetamido-2,4,6-trideoxy-beta-L-altropyranose hydrolase [Opitutae bacterium]|tara:strand:- start:3173 stop:4726 length:1554 start_codon:yes stop_codon:yes gene_type:complete
MKISILIRADAGGALGTGHVMRMIALAQGYLRRGGSVSLASVNCPEKLVERVRSHGITHHTIIAAQPGDTDDAQQTAELAKELDAEWLVVDGYHFDYEYQKYVKQFGFSLLCTDDHGYSDCWHCDVILNQNLDANLRIDYKNDLLNTKVLSGPAYCLLREEFLDAQTEKCTWGSIECLLVTLGGSDLENATEATLQLVDQACERPLNIRVLVGADNPHLERLRVFESHHNVEVVQNATNMPEQYAWADGIISAGGSTCWEWLYWGLPGAIVTIADNQLPIVDALTVARQAALPLGWFNGAAFGANTKPLSEWIHEPAKVCDATVANGMIDGGGADRVVSSLLGELFYFRPVSLWDFEMTFSWANDSHARLMSFSSEMISREVHLDWLKRKLADDKVWHQIVELNELAVAVGVVRVEKIDASANAVISINLSPSIRGKGYGSQIIREASQRYCDESGETCISAYAKLENIASVRAFQKAGYTCPVQSDLQQGDAVVMFFNYSVEADVDNNKVELRNEI